MKRTATNFLVVGLGNPGIKYHWTRHNLGFLAIEKFGEQKAILLKKQKIFGAYIGQGKIAEAKVILCKPLTYINCSGEVVKKIVDRYDIDNKNILIVCDDLNLTLGKIRIRQKGSDGGHNGLKSIIDCLGTKEFGRLRVGINSLPDTYYPLSATDYVLSKFSKEEKKVVGEAIARAAQAAETIISKGIEKAMNKYN